MSKASGVRPGDDLSYEPSPKRPRSSEPPPEREPGHIVAFREAEGNNFTSELSAAHRCTWTGVRELSSLQDSTGNGKSCEPVPDGDSLGVEGGGLIPHYESGSAEFEGVLEAGFDDEGKNELPGLVPHYGSGDVEASTLAKEHSSGQVFSLLADYEDDDDNNDDGDGEDRPLVAQEDVETQTKLAERSDTLKSELDASPSKTSQTVDLAKEASTPEKKSVDLPPHLKVGQGTPLKAQEMENDKDSAQIQGNVGDIGNTDKKVQDEGQEGNGSEHSPSGSIQSPAESDACTEDLDNLLPEEYRQPPMGEVSSSVQETVKSLLEVQMKQNIFFNEEIMVNKQFRNPCFLTKMSNHFGINEFGTLLSPEIYDPKNLPREDMAEGLRAERQRRASASHVASNPGTGGRVTAPLSAPPGVQNAILQGRMRLREKFTVMAGGKTRQSKWDSGR